MAQINLSSGESFTVSGGTNTISGSTTGGETVTINGGVNTFTADFNSGGDRIILAGSANQYTVERSGSSIILRGPSGTVVTFPAPNPNLPDAQNPRITFANSGAPQDYVLDSTTAGVFTVTPTGGAAQTVGTTAATVTGGTVTPPAPTATVNVTASDVNEGGTIVYTFTLSSAQTSAVTINVATTGGSATAGTDYIPVSQQITFNPGETVKFLNVTTIDDTQPEAAETVTITVGLPAGISLAAGADLTSVIAASDGSVPQQFILTTGNDTFVGGDASDRFVGAQITTEPGKLLSANDVLDGGNGVDSLELTNAQNSAANNLNALSDIDFTNVVNIETLITNYNVVQLGAQADKAGIVTVDTRTRTDSQNVAAVQANFTGTNLDLTSDANNDGIADFNNALNVQMANSVADTVRLQLASAAGSSIDTGSNFTFANNAGVATPIDNIVISGQAVTGGVPAQVRVTLAASGQVGDGNAFALAADGVTRTTDLAVALQSEDAAGNLTGGIVRVDDEGLRLSSTQAGVLFDVRDTQGNNRGTFADVQLGTIQGETFNAAAGGSYLNAGGGNDTLNGSNSVDVLVGGAGNDIITGGGGADTLIGGTGNDVYLFGEGEFNGTDQITEGARDFTNAALDGGFDYLGITQTANITDANFTNAVTASSVGNIEGIAVNLNFGGVGTLTAGSAAAATGITTFVMTNDTLNITAAYNLAATVYTTGNVAIASTNQNDVVALQGTNPVPAFASYTANASYAGSIATGTGDDIVYAGYALQGAFNAGAGSPPVFGVPAATTATIDADGGANDTLVIGGAVGGLGGTAPAGNSSYALLLGAGITGFENLTITNAGAGASVAYQITINAANVGTAAAGGNLNVNASALRAADAANSLNAETLNFNAAALTGAIVRTVNVTGGAADDVLTGGDFNDTLNGGGGVDTLNGGLGNDTILGGAGADLITAGGGDELLLDGQGDNDTYFFTNDFGAADVVNDSGASAGDVLDVTFNNGTVITDAMFANKQSVEVLTTNVSGGATLQNDATPAGAAGLFEVSVGTLARQAGIRTVNAGNDDVNASGFDADGLVINIGSTAFANNAGNVTGSGFNDVVNINVQTLYAGNGNISLGGGNDKLVAGFTIDGASGNASQTATLAGGAGQDEIVLGGDAVAGGYAAGGFGTSTYNFAANANFTGWELITISATPVGTVAAPQNGRDFAINVSASNALGTNAQGYFRVDASALTGTIVGPAAPNNTQQLFFSGGALTAAGGANAGGATNTALDVVGGGNDDIIITGNGADRLTGGAGNDRLEGGAGFDNYFGGDGNDTIVLSVVEFNNDADTIDGGEGGETSTGGPLNQGGDTLLLRGTQNLAAGGGVVQEIADVGFSTRIVAGSIEQITLEGIIGGNTVFNYTAGFYSQTAGVNVINVGARASGSTVSITNYTVGGTTLNDVEVGVTNDTTFLGSQNADIFNLGLVNTTRGGGTDIVRAANGADTINFGSTLVTSAAAAAGNDLVDGGAGSDTLNVSGTGGAGLNNQSVFLRATVAGGVVTEGVYSVERLNVATGAGASVTAVGQAAATVGATSYVVNVYDTTFDGANSTIVIDGSTLRTNVTTAAAGGNATAVADETLVVTAGGNVTGTGHAIDARGGAGNDSLTGGSGKDILNGGGGNDTINGGIGDDQIDGGTGDDTLFGGVGNDIITGGLGADTITGGAGADIINLGNDGFRDRVIFATNDAPRSNVGSAMETINGFTYDGTSAGLDAAADTIDFGTTVTSDTSSGSIVNGVVQASSGLQAAINSSSSLLAAIQLIEQEFQGGAEAAVDNSGVVVFTYQNNTYVGNVNFTIPGNNASEAFSDIVMISGQSTVSGLTFDPTSPGGTSFGLTI